MAERIDSIGVRQRRPGPKPTTGKAKPIYGASGSFSNPVPGEFPSDRDYLYVDYGNIHDWIRLLVAGTPTYQVQDLIKSRRWRRFPSGTLLVELKNIHRSDNSAKTISTGPRGGKISLKNGGYLQDVHSLFMQPWTKTKQAYGSDDLASIMERTRKSLETGPYPLKPASRNSWWSMGSIARQLLGEYKVDLRDLPLAPKEVLTSPIIKHGIFGHYPDTIYVYDLVHAYNYYVSLYDPLKAFSQHIYGARQELKRHNDPAERIPKLVGPVLPGMFNSQVINERYYRPDLFEQIVGRCRRRVSRAIAEVRLRGGIVIRVNTDGFIANIDITDYLQADLPGVGNDLGQWKEPEVYEDIVIGGPNLFFTGADQTGKILVKTGGFLTKGRDITREDLLERSEGLSVSQQVIDWGNTLEVKDQPEGNLSQWHDHRYCIPGASWHFIADEGRYSWETQR